MSVLKYHFQRLFVSCLQYPLKNVLQTFGSTASWEKAELITFGLPVVRRESLPVARVIQTIPNHSVSVFSFTCFVDLILILDSDPHRRVPQMTQSEQIWALRSIMICRKASPMCQ